MLELKHVMKKFFTVIGNLYFYKTYNPPCYVINNEKKIIYLQNSKVACSSIEVALLSQKEVVEDDYSIHSLKGIHTTNNINLDDFSNYYTFTFVRNPFSRLVSCYESKYHTDKEKLSNNNRKVHLRYDDYLCGYLKKDKGFKNFIIKIFVIPIFL